MVKTNSMAQSVGASTPGLCRAGRHRFDPWPPPATFCYSSPGLHQFAPLLRLLILPMETDRTSYKQTTLKTEMKTVNTFC